MDENNKKITNTNFNKFRSGRRQFIKNLAALTLTSQFGLVQSCVKAVIPPSSLLDKTQYNILISVQNILFPRDAYGPGAFDFDAHEYVLWFLGDTRQDSDEQNYIIKGLDWVNETAEEDFAKNFLDLKPDEKIELISAIAGLEWGENWLSTILNYIFEAMISDPLYGFNKDGIGWKWLNHQVGYPRPTKKLLYDEIFKTVAQNR